MQCELTMSISNPPPKPFNPASITRPDPKLMRYYILTSFLVGPFFPIALLPLFFKYETLKYCFDDEGISMSWGLLFRREIHLTYRRIQDIHLTRNLFQRWMGLATVDVQTASGSAGPEMSIEGVLAASELRDFLYAKMRGARGESDAEATGAKHVAETENDEALVLLSQIRDSLQQLVQQKESGS
jgi:putative membrane protein